MFEELYCLKNLLFLNISFYLYFYISLRLSSTFCLFSGNIYLLLGVSVHNPIYPSVSEVLCDEVLEKIADAIADSYHVNKGLNFCNFNVI